MCVLTYHGWGQYSASMARRDYDPEAHCKAAQKIIFEEELCEDLIGAHLTQVPEEARPYVRLALRALVIELRKRWRPHLLGEWKRDRAALLRLIEAVFSRWEKASFERPLVLHQLATNPKNRRKAMSLYLDAKEIGASAAAKEKTQRQNAACQAADRKKLSRGSKEFRVPEEQRVPKDEGDLAWLAWKFAGEQPVKCDM